MLINATQSEEVRLPSSTVKTYDLDIENAAREQKRQVSKAKLTRVEPSLKPLLWTLALSAMAFCLKRNFKIYFKKGASQRAPIQELVKEGQEILVQVEKEERGNKALSLHS